MYESHSVTLEEFSTFFLNSIRAQADELIRSSTSACNTPQKPSLSRQESQHRPRHSQSDAENPPATQLSNIPPRNPQFTDAPEHDTSFGDSYDIATLRDKSQCVADSSFILNKSTRRLFPTTDSPNQSSSDFDTSSLLLQRSHSNNHQQSIDYDDKHMANNHKRNHQQPQNRHQGPSNLDHHHQTPPQTNPNQHQRCFKNNLLTSTPIRGGNLPRTTHQDGSSPAPFHPSMNHTFPLRQPTAATMTTNMANHHNANSYQNQQQQQHGQQFYFPQQNHHHHQQQQHQHHGHRKQANRTISLGECMSSSSSSNNRGIVGRPERDEFPALGHNNNHASNHRRKAQSSANVSSGGGPTTSRDQQVTPLSSATAAAAPSTSSAEKGNVPQQTTVKQKPKRRVVPISLSSTPTTSGGGGGGKKRDPSAFVLHSSSSTAPSSSAISVALSPTIGSVGERGESHSARVGALENDGGGFGTTEFMSSPFRNANNLLSVQGEEQDQQPVRDLHDTRRLLLEEKAAIRTDFNEEARRNGEPLMLGTGSLRAAVQHLLAKGGEVGGGDELQQQQQQLEKLKEGENVTSPVDVKALMKDLKNRDKLDVCVEIYSMILNLNLTANVLNELTFLLTLINMEVQGNSNGGGAAAAAATATMRMRQMSIEEGANEEEEEEKDVTLKKVNVEVPQSATRTLDFEVLFKAPLNCIYLAVEVLNKQREKLLALLDARTLRILIENEKLGLLHGELISYLQDVYRLKGELELRYCTEYEGFKAGQQNSINSSQYLTNRGGVGGGVGGTGGGQQNVFYQAEEDTRDNFPTQAEFVAFRKQRDLFYVILRMWEERHLHPNWNFTQELGGRIRYLFVVMPHPINMAHLAKLLTSQLIVCCQNWNNVEQSAAQAELLQRFDNVDLSKLSKLEQRLVQPGNFSAELQFPGIQVFFKEFFVVAESSPAFIEQLKIALMAELIARNDSTFEVVTVTTTSPIRGSEVNEIVVGPEAMSIMRVLAKFLGFVISQPYQYQGHQNKAVDNRQVELRNLQLPPFDVFAVLEVAQRRDKLLITVPWMVEYLAMLDAVTLQLDYYRKLLGSLYRLYVELPYQENRSPMTCFILRLCLGWLFEQSHVTASLCSLNLLAIRLEIGEKKIMQNLNSETIAGMLHPVLEKILPVACPFLADFRLTIVPKKQNTRLVSRTTGRYRHIVTTKLPFANQLDSVAKNVQSLTANVQSIPDNQSKLVEAFLQSQSPSLRKIVDFQIERISSTAIKDFQIQHFLEIKKNAQMETKRLNGTLGKKALLNLLVDIYSKALLELTKQWTETVPESIEKKVIQSLDALLPVETIVPVRKTCVDIVIKMCTAKTNDWRVANLNQIDIFSKDLDAEANKIIKTKQSGVVESSETMVISIDHTYPSVVYQKIQFVQHITSMYPDQLTTEQVESVLEDVTECYKNNTFTNSTTRHILGAIHQLIILIIARNAKVVTQGVLEKLANFYMCDKFRDANQKLEESPTTVEKTQTTPAKNCIFPESAVILPRILIHYFEVKNSFKVLANYLITLIDNEFISLETLNENLVALLRFEWPPEKCKHLSMVMKIIRQRSGNRSGKEDLLLDVLSELTANIDDFEGDDGDYLL